VASKTEEAKRFEAYKALAFDEAKHNCEYFIEEFVKIEDRDSAELATAFNLWPNQRAGLRTILKNKLVVALKARQLGFSWLSLAYAVWMIALHPGKSVLALSKTEEDAKELVRRAVFILRNLPDWMIRQSNAPDKNAIVFEFMATQVTIHNPGGEPSFFRSFPAGQNSGAGFTGNLLILDEWALQQYAEEIWTAAYPTINRPTGGQVIGISTMRLGSFFETVVRGAMAGTNGFIPIFWPWNTDPRRDEAWYKATLNALGEEKTRQEYPATIEEALAAAGGKFFNELRADVHLVKPPDRIQEHYKRYRSIDYGFDCTAVLWYYIDFRGYARVYKALKKPGMMVSEAAEEIKNITGDDRIDYTFAPDDLWNTQTTSGKSAADLFAENGIWLTPTSRKRESGWMNVREWLRVHEVKEIDGNVLLTARMTFELDAQSDLWKDLNALLSEKNNPRDAAKDPHDITHLSDSLRAFCVYWQSPSERPKEAEKNMLEDRTRRNLQRLVNERKHGKKVEYC
jgi:hypothetical protein